MPRDLTISALFVGGLLALGAIGARATHAERQASGGASARSTEAVVRTPDPGWAQTIPTPRPLADPPQGQASVLPNDALRSLPPNALHQEEPMDRLRQLLDADPELSMQLAREANERYPESPDAAERATIIVKALARMGRADEATAEAREVVEKYAGTSWALDVKRHMLDVPP